MNIILVSCILTRLVSTWVIYHVSASQASSTCLRGGLVCTPNYSDSAALEVLEEKRKGGVIFPLLQTSRLFVLFPFSPVSLDKFR